MIAVQIVQINWTKATRGAPRANERAALSRAFAISNLVINKYRLQHYTMDEQSDFKVKLLSEDASAQVPVMERSLTMKMDETGVLKLGMRWQSSDGQPRRHSRPEVLQLKPGEYARLMMNGRYTTYSGQHYSEMLYNVAYGDNIAAARFLNGKPDHEFSLAEHLF